VSAGGYEPTSCRWFEGCQLSNTARRGCRSWFRPAYLLAWSEFVLRRRPPPSHAKSDSPVRTPARGAGEIAAGFPKGTSGSLPVPRGCVNLCDELIFGRQSCEKISAALEARGIPRGGCAHEAQRSAREARRTARCAAGSDTLLFLLITHYLCALAWSFNSSFVHRSSVLNMGERCCPRAGGGETRREEADVTAAAAASGIVKTEDEGRELALTSVCSCAQADQAWARSRGQGRVGTA